MDGKRSVINFPHRIDRLLRDFEAGIYTLRELLPLLVLATPEGKEADLVEMLPDKVLESFKKWVKGYPLTGGISIRNSGETISVSAIATLKSFL